MIIKNVTVKGVCSDITIENGKITAVTAHDPNAEGQDFGGAVAIPGLVDIHSHGCVGFDTMDGQFAEMCDFLAKNGTTSWCPTTMTMDFESISKAMNGNTDVPGTNILGFHMEGPYISPKFKGAQNEKFIKSPDMEEFSKLPNIKMVTIAPELEGSLEFIKECPAVVALGHTACDYDTAIAAIDAGANCLTHTFNAMPPIHHRNPGPIGAAAERQIYAQVISDGLHLHKAAVLMLYKLFGSDRMVLISDSMRATGMTDGEYEFGGQPIEVKDGVARTMDGAIAGSTSTLWQCVKKATEFGIPFDEAVKMASEVPAAHIGVDTKGKIETGYDADIIILDKDGEIDRVIIGGEFYK
ncbi:MAG: N-acetylglucosamine-6-phosphate deacetylase [Clostridia bacterium]|nr:N-acetylglucosamine-6-phosphate deacetylase [Oscillospiraceae bacterium]MBQ6797239.1 N-acetylglucosamine-6-phosphate deacetylase [Clostridia bacterium]